MIYHYLPGTDTDTIYLAPICFISYLLIQLGIQWVLPLSNAMYITSKSVVKVTKEGVSQEWH